MRRTFDKLINTRLHSKVGKDKCLEIFLLKGDANEINEKTRQFQGNRNMDNIELVVIYCSFILLLSYSKILITTRRKPANTTSVFS